MIDELRAAIELIGKCPEDIQRAAAAALSVQAAQHEARSRLTARLEGRSQSQSLMSSSHVRAGHER